MKLLIVEDEKKTGEYLTKGLTEAGFVVDLADNGLNGYHLAMTGDYDLIILDIMLPDVNGWDIVRMLRSANKGMPILLLTALGTIEHRVKGLELGADDYLVKPFSFDELLARVRALLRRQSEVRSPVLKLDDLVMDTASKTVQRGGKKLLLTSKEYALLEYLLRHQGQTLTRSQISDHVWNFDFDYDSNIVDVYIRYLRNKVDKPFPNKLIHTVRGFGYVMRCGDA